MLVMKILTANFSSNQLMLAMKLSGCKRAKINVCDEDTEKICQNYRQHYERYASAVASVIKEKKDM